MPRYQQRQQWQGREAVRPDRDAGVQACTLDLGGVPLFLAAER
jgi:hypothetical protein